MKATWFISAGIVLSLMPSLAFAQEKNNAVNDGDSTQLETPEAPESSEATGLDGASSVSAHGIRDGRKRFGIELSPVGFGVMGKNPEGPAETYTESSVWFGSFGAGLPVSFSVISEEQWEFGARGTMGYSSGLGQDGLTLGVTPFARYLFSGSESFQPFVGAHGIASLQYFSAGGASIVGVRMGLGAEAGFHYFLNDAVSVDGSAFVGFDIGPDFVSADFGVSSTDFAYDILGVTYLGLSYWFD